jgi:hypothetical protein
VYYLLKRVKGLEKERKGQQFTTERLRGQIQHLETEVMRHFNEIKRLHRQMGEIQRGGEFGTTDVVWRDIGPEGAAF